jgi:alkaline phosphatase
MRFRIAALALAAAMTAGCASVPTAAPRNIILFVGSGMGFNTLTAARIYSVGESGDLTIDTLPESAFVKTYSNDRQVTDESAAMSALLSGRKANSGALSVQGCPDGKPAPTLLELAAQRGMGTGLVSNVPVTDALVAPAFVHGCSHPGGAVAAAALVPGGAGFNTALGKGIDVILGGGAADFTQRADGRDLLAELRAQDYAHVQNLSELDMPQAARSKRLVGLFAPRDMAGDTARDVSKQPNMSQLTSEAIERLARDGKGFVLVVASGLIDRAAHQSDARMVLEEVTALDKALRTAVDSMQRRDPGLKNTLIVATASHDSTLVMNGYSIITGKTTATEPGVLGLLRSYSNGKIYKDNDGAPFTIIGFGNGPNRVDGKRPATLDAATVAAPHYQYESVIRMAPDATTHGGTDVYLGAIGAGAERFRGTLDNTEVFNLIKAAAGL